MSGTDRTQQPMIGGPRVILIEPQLGENIGAAARAMLNCGAAAVGVSPSPPQAERMTTNAKAASAIIEDCLSIASASIPVSA